MPCPSGPLALTDMSIACVLPSTKSSASTPSLPSARSSSTARPTRHACASSSLRRRSTTKASSDPSRTGGATESSARACGLYRSVGSNPPARSSATHLHARTRPHPSSRAAELGPAPSSGSHDRHSQAPLSRVGHRAAQPINCRRARSFIAVPLCTRVKRRRRTASSARTRSASI